ncbi:AAA family ATPase [Dactylosporangium sp. NPDC048998]|uniref:AAA family ATPase n=1 Tax=Dactylosporangium sp. NPDC048998 TaxID=3363976 RepID=UPI00371ED773
MGRDDEVSALAAAFTDALDGRCRAVLVGGAPGVGKSALVDGLRPVVTDRDGWFVAGKFDQYRRDLEFDAVHQDRGGRPGLRRIHLLPDRGGPDGIHTVPTSPR